MAAKILLLLAVQLVALTIWASYSTQAAFCVTRSTNVDQGEQVIDFDGALIDEPSSGFDTITDTFSPPETGIYWLHFSAGLPNDGNVTDVRLVLPTHTINILRRYGGAPHTGSRSELVQLTAGVDSLSISTAETLFNDAKGVFTSFSGFHLDSTMNPVVAFSVACSRTGPLYFDTVLLDTYSGWQPENNRYRIPIAGIWVITLSVGEHPTAEGTTLLNARDWLSGKSDRKMTEIIHELHHYTFTGPDMGSTTLITSLVDGDNVVTSSDAIYSDSFLQSAMSGFLYSPINQPPVAWHVSSSIFRNGPRDAIPFEITLLNEGVGWDGDTNRFFAPVGGLYFVSITGTSFLSNPMYIELVQNAQTVLGAIRAGPIGSPQTITRSRALIVRLKAGDTLRLRLPTGYSVEGCAPYYCSAFSGFRLSV